MIQSKNVKFTLSVKNVPLARIELALPQPQCDVLAVTPQERGSRVGAKAADTKVKKKAGPSGPAEPARLFTHRGLIYSLLLMTASLFEKEL